jgi:PAT family beta-lactamase induction signal transducer AmpG
MLRRVLARFASKATGLVPLLCNRRMLLCLLTGFSSGLPLYVSLSLLQAWLHKAGMSLGEIGLFNLTGLPYVLKFLWAPLLDRYCPPFLGRRRGWAFPMQVALMLCIGLFGFLDPARSPGSVAWLALCMAIFSATQDIALDAYRRELLADHELGLGTAMYVNAYRFSAFVPALALVLADHLAWSWVYVIVAAFMLVGILASLLAPQEPAQINPPRTLRDAVVLPFREFFVRKDLATALLILLFMLLYKLGDTMAGALVTPFYLSLEFTLTEVGSVAKAVAVPATAAGLLAGGVTIARIGINRALWLFGVGQMLSTLGFAVLARVGPDVWVLGSVVALEYLAGGLGTAAFVAFLARTTDRRFTATQYALFSALIAVPRTVVSASTGYLAEALGFGAFFVLCAALGIPGMLLLGKVAPWANAPKGLSEDLSRPAAR